MTPSSEHSLDAERRDAAADWLQRLPDKNMSEDDLQAWLHWYGASEANRHAFDKAQSFYLGLRGMNPRQRAILRALMPVPNPPVKWKRRHILLAAAACFAAAALMFGVRPLIEREPQALAYAAPIDRYRTVRLSDGSAMVLGARAVANVSYTRTARVLDVLQGTAYFEVKHDARRPFVVRAGEISVTALGTAFSVAREADSLRITVTEGSVDVMRALSSSPAAPEGAPRKHLRVKAGERTTFTVGPAPLSTPSPALNAANVWQNDSVQFFNAPLGDVVKVVNVHARHRILIEDPRVTDLNYSGTVFRERIDEWIAALPQVYPVRKVSLEDGSVTLVLRSAESGAP